MQTVDERCKELGLQVYDTAVPQEWADDVCAKTGIYPAGEVVWCYDGSLLGYPVALTPKGEEAIDRYKAS